MNSTLKAILILSLLSNFATCQSENYIKDCLWKDIQGNSYDLSTLKKSDFWKVLDKTQDSGVFGIMYKFNFCQQINVEKCKNANVGAMESLQVLGQNTDSCEVLGRIESSTVEHINQNDPSKGVIITYNNGDICKNSESSADLNKPRKIRFQINCASSASSAFEKVKINSLSVTNCNLLFQINSPAGCIVGAGIGGSAFEFFHKMFTYTIIILLIYFVVGYYYNYKYNELRGIEAIPQLEFWNGVASKVIELSKLGFSLVKEKIQNLTGKGGSSGNSSQNNLGSNSAKSNYTIV